jgi:hypothetical protein
MSKEHESSTAVEHGHKHAGPTAPDVSAGLEPAADTKGQKPIPEREVQVVKAGESGIAEAQRRTTAADRRRSMEGTIKGGGTIFYHDPKKPNSPPRHISRIEDLPHEAEMAEGVEDQAAAKRQIDSEIKRLQDLKDGMGKTK